jgi:DNA-binding beta-propeller fold protein YncE
MVLVLLALLLFGAAMVLGTLSAEPPAAATAVAPSPAVGGEAETPAGFGLTSSSILSLAGALVVMILALVFLVRSIGWEQIRSQRPFDLLMVLGTLVLPLLTAFPVKMVGWNPLDYSTNGMLRTGIFLVLMFLIAGAVGWWWNRRIWPMIAAMFYGVFIVLYTTFFTNGQGFFTGIIGSLGYWISQQGVQRGSQPWYYFALIQMPVYEYIAILGTLLAVFFGVRKRMFSTIPGEIPEIQSTEASPQEKIPVLGLFVFWAFTSLIAYSVAGEKMPWLTVHITLGFLLAAGWGMGYLIDHIQWSEILNYRGIVAVVLMPVFLASVTGILGSLLGNQPPFQGKTLEQLQSTSTFLLAFITAVVGGGGIIWLQAGWHGKQIASLLGIVFFTFMSILTIRTAAMASYINYDTPLEYMVYAHAARGPKDVLEQVEEISQRLTRGLDVVVAYDNDGLYPYWWYFRDYPNHRWYTDKPTRDLRDVPLIIAGDATMGKMAPIIQDNYLQFEYMRLWWPNQDYWDLTWERVWNAVSSPEMRRAIFNIWLNRDYTLYAKVTNNETLTLENWQPSAKMKFFIRKDVASQIWNYGAVPAAAAVVEEEIDPYKDKVTWFSPDLTFGVGGSLPGQLQAPRGIAVAADGSIYVADSRNHRIQHFTAEGELLQNWGTFADAAAGDAPGGTFNEPWGVAVAPDGTVYVTDTWNHRVQKFSPDGQFIATWGYFGQAETPEAFWGPRGIAVDKKGRVYIMDTGNKRVVVFGPDQKFITQFGSAGLELGQFDEPVGIALDENGNAYITDTWNQRIQVFAPDAEGTTFVVKTSWDVYGWFGQSLDNKPFISVSPGGQIFITDPEGYRVLVFDSEGNFVRGWGDYSAGTDGFGMPAGVAFDNQGRVWISDAANNLLMRFSLP